jgi:hypothetical protein
MNSVESSSELGYVSLSQLKEYAIQSNPDWSEVSSRLVSLRLFLDAIRMGVPAVGVDPEVEPAPERSFGHPKLLDADVFKQMLESGELAKPVPYAYAHGVVTPKGIDRHSEELAVNFIEERTNFLARQQG